MKIRIFILAGATTMLAACATSQESYEKYSAMDCETLAQVAENYERTNWADQIDLYNDSARQSERRASGSPWSDKTENKRDADNQIRKDRDAIRKAYLNKGCKG